MKSSKLPISIFLPLLLLGACAPSGSGNGGSGGSHSGSGGTSGGTGGTNGGSGGSSMACSGSKVTAAEANNYMFSSTITLQTIDVKSMSNLTIDWGDLSKDFEGHSLDPKKDINQVLFIDWLFPLDKLEEKINADDLNGDVFEGLPLGYTTDGNTTSAKIYDFMLATGGDIQQSDIDPFLDPSVSPSSTHTLTAIAATGQLGSGTRMIQAMALNPSSSNTTVKLQNDSTKLQFTANLHDLTPTYIPSGQSGVTLDWGKLKKTATNKDFDPTSITHALLGKYSQSPSDLEGNNFLDLQTIAQELYEGDIDSGTVVDFSKLQTSSGKGFSGISGDGTWLVALMCGACKNPAPLFLTVLKPCP